jgi:hypothetical protein
MMSFSEQIVPVFKVESMKIAEKAEKKSKFIVSRSFASMGELSSRGAAAAGPSRNVQKV